MSTSPCPCGRPRELEACCGPCVAGEQAAPDPESLMRSRYTAFAVGTEEAIDYLVETHHRDHRSPNLASELRTSLASVDSWERLEVLFADSDGERGTVEFIATYRVRGKRLQLRERSDFVREDGRWFYTRGVIS